MAAKFQKIHFDVIFKPCSVDDGDELYRNGFFEFNISKLKTHLESCSEMVRPQNIELRQYIKIYPTDLDPHTVQNANLKEPIILGEISPCQYNVIDGNHRVDHAREKNIETLLAYLVGPDIHYRFLTSLKAYKAYVTYWNEKVSRHG